MIKLNSIGSSSTGNCFIISDGITDLILDIGMKTKDIQSGLFKINKKLQDINGVLITHEHSDHIQGIHSVRGCKKYMTRGTFEAAEHKYNINKQDVVIISDEEQFQIGTWKIKAFKVHHDAAEPVCFIMSNSSGERVLYLTDTNIANYNLINADMYIIEANHSYESLKKRYEKGLINEDIYKRITDNHLSLESTYEYLNKNIGDKTKHIILMHLSPSNTNPVGTMNYIRARINSPNVSFIHPVSHKVNKTWEVGFKPTRKREF